MIFEVVSTAIMGGIALKAHQSRKGIGNDSKKINKIFALSGLNVKDGNETLTAQQIRKRDYDWGTEYRYRIPFGRSFEDYVAKQKIIESGINTRKVKIEFKDLKELKFNKNIISNIKDIREKKLTDKKEIEILEDGLLKIRVYNEPMKTEIEWSESLLKSKSWCVPIGYLRDGNVIFHDFDKAKHIIIAGATGYGKSAILKMIVTTLMVQQPDNVKLSLIDLKGGAAFHRFKDCEQVKNYSRDPKTAEEVLKKVQKEMNENFNKVVDNGFEDVKEAGIPERHFIVIDEAADLADYETAMDIITDIARRGRSAGYYLVFCTQYPTSQVIPSQTKRNIIARLCYVVDTDTASRVVLDEGGADLLPDIPGRGIYKNLRKSTLQTPYMSNKQIQDLIKPFIVQDKGVKNDEASYRETGEDTVIIEKTRFS